MEKGKTMKIMLLDNPVFTDDAVNFWAFAGNPDSDKLGSPGDKILVQKNEKDFVLAAIRYILFARLSDVPKFVFSRYVDSSVENLDTFKLSLEKDVGGTINFNVIITIIGFEFI